MSVNQSKRSRRPFRPPGFAFIKDDLTGDRIDARHSARSDICVTSELAEFPAVALGWKPERSAVGATLGAGCAENGIFENFPTGAHCARSVTHPACAIIADRPRPFKFHFKSALLTVDGMTIARGVRVGSHARADVRPVERSIAVTPGRRMTTKAVFTAGIERPRLTTRIVRVDQCGDSHSN
jgi:hypothetical protein